MKSRRWKIGAAAILAGVLLRAPAARAETIPPDSWVYETLKSFELRGLVALEPTLPYTFDQCEAYTREIAANVEARGVALGPRHAFLLERLVKQFVGTRDRPEDRWSKPVYTVREEERFAAMDLAIGGIVQRKVDEKKGEADGLLFPDLLLGFGHNITMETSYRLVMAPERGNNVTGAKPEARLRSYDGLTAELERATIDASGAWWDIRIGREYLHWGSNLREDLILSRTAGSLDHFGGRIKLGRFALSAVQVSLDPGEYRRHLAGHRLSVALPRGAFVGFSETVVYANRNFDYMYLVPLGAFYAQQFNEASNEDNIFWAFDWKVPLRRGLLFYGQFLVDDIQYQRDENAGPDRLGLCVAADALFTTWGREIELSGGYTAVTKYTYGHSFETQYVAGNGDEYMNPLLGSPMGPDANREFIKATLGVSSRTALTLEGARTMYGKGSIPGERYLLDWVPGADEDLTFLHAHVHYVKFVRASLRYDLNHGSYISAGAWMRFHDPGVNDFQKKQLLGWLEVVLDL